MSYLSAIIQILVAIPKVYNLIMGLLDLINKEKKAKEEKERIESIEAMKKAKTIEEVKRANAGITNNLP